MKAFAVFFWLSLSGFIYQWMQVTPEYIVAMERAYFTGVALFTYWVVDKFIWRD